jgi:hypothetical protein
MSVLVALSQKQRDFLRDGFGDAGSHVTLAEDRVSERKPMLAQFRLSRQESTRGEPDERQEKNAGNKL